MKKILFFCLSVFFIGCIPNDNSGNKEGNTSGYVNKSGDKEEEKLKPAATQSEKSASKKKTKK